LEELWTLHEEITGELSGKICVGKAKLEDRLRKRQTLGTMVAPSASGKFVQARDQKITAYTKYRDPDNPLQTWAGRSKQPRWLQAQLRSEEKVDDGSN
jgi:DNA-binding protein H-NS